MGDGGDTRDDLKLPDSDLGREITTKFEADEQFSVSNFMFIKPEPLTAISQTPCWMQQRKNRKGVQLAQCNKIYQQCFFGLCRGQQGATTIYIC